MHVTVDGSEAEARAALLMRLRRSGIRNLAVLRAMEALPRSRFVPAHLAGHAMRDIALPIGCGQTSPRPSFVARALEALECGGNETVLEIGSGSGFVTALLAKITARVDGTERFSSLAEAARSRLRDLDLDNASVSWADGLAPASTPMRYDRILLNVAVATLPSAILDQLAPGGIVVYPRGAGPQQMLVRVKSDPDADLTEAALHLSEVSPAMPGRSAIL